MPAISMSDYREFVRSGPYVFPGGGEAYILTEDGGLLCHECAYNERRQIIDAIARHDRTGGWLPAAFGNTYNEEPSPRTCDHCGAEIGDQGEPNEDE